MVLGIGSDDAVKVWVNGETAHENWMNRQVRSDEDIVPVSLVRGRNSVLLTVENVTSHWGFACRLMGPDSLTRRLFTAISQGRRDDAEALVEGGTDLAFTEYGQTPLHVARITGYTDLAEYLTTRGADADATMPPAEEVLEAS